MTRYQSGSKLRLRQYVAVVAAWGKPYCCGLRQTPAVRDDGLGLRSTMRADITTVVARVSDASAGFIVLFFAMRQRSGRKEHNRLANIVTQIDPHRGKEIQLIEGCPVENSAGFSAFGFVELAGFVVTRYCVVVCRFCSRVPYPPLKGTLR